MYPKIPPQSLYKVPLKQVPVDMIITNANVFNSLTGEFLQDQCIWIKDGWIAYVGPDREPLEDENTKTIDLEGSTVLPGLIEAHTHVMSLTGVEEFIRHVIPSGTTTVITETIELALVSGPDGFRFLIKALRDQPIRFFYTLAPLAAASQALEIYAPGPEVYEELLKDPYCVGVGEIYWANGLNPETRGQRIREIAQAALSMDKRVQGHTAGAYGNKLQAYTDLGASSCHEPIKEQDAIERLRLGYWIMIRQGAIRKELDAIAPIFQKPIDHRRIIISTDSMDPESLLTEGSLDAAVRRALELGIPPKKVYQSVTINAAEHFRLDHIIGFIGPCKLADLVVIPSPNEYHPLLVMREGEIIFQNGEIRRQVRKTEFPEWMFHTVKLHSVPELALPKKGKYRAMEMVTRLVTKEAVVDLSDENDSGDTIMALALERTGRGGSFLGLLKGYGLNCGACGSTMCWDTTDMLVLGTDSESMLTVIKRLKEIEGGTVFAIGNEIVAEFHAGLCGIVTVDPMEVAREKIRLIEDVLHRYGVPWEKPMLSLITLTSAAIPHLSITHEGYVRLKDFAILGTEL